MSDQDSYDSEEDLDYIPSEGEQASEEENSGDEEDLSLLKDDDAEIKETSQKRKSKAKKKNAINTRKRRGGIKLDDKDGNVASEGAADTLHEAEEESKRRKELAEEIALEEESKRRENEKKRADDLWSSFMCDVKQPPRVTGSSSSLISQVKTTNGSEPIAKSEGVVSGRSGKVTITRIFDFAGEEVKVTREVDADSKEAKAEQKKQEKPNEETLKSSAQPGPGSIGSELKRPAVSGLGSVLNKINKKSKMGTLEKSKIDWNAFKKKEGIDEDLKIYNKGKQGYTERMAFLNRADQRQFEIERDLRLGSTSKR